LSACIFFVAAATRLFAQQVEESTIPLNPPAVINFKQEAGYQLAHPHPAYAQRFIEQGEDREGRRTYIPKPVAEDAKRSDVAIPQATLRTVSLPPNISFNGTPDDGTLIPPD